MSLQGVAKAAALNIDRLAAWFALRPLSPTRTLRFKALAAWLMSSPTVSGRFLDADFTSNSRI
jgi:hypothetical protein